ncbi:MAG TPA: hypothetical protein VNT60_02795 [Deinococcales bacterium]|nr:hypothetical protein [Deinococcales bacterium]
MKVSPSFRQAYDQDFMGLLAAVRQQVLDAQPPPMAASSPVAAMFFKEAQQSVLRELAELTAAWNRSEVDTGAVERALSGLDGLGLTTLRDRLASLAELASRES